MQGEPKSITLSKVLGAKLTQLVAEEPDTLMERTPEQVQQVVEAELLTAQQKMDALKKGKDWKVFTKAEVMHK
jgi:hypothetical protein